MTITLAPNRTTTSGTAEPVVLDGGLFFQPLTVIEQAGRLAGDGIDVVVTLPLGGLDIAPLRGTTRMMLEASVASRLRSALTAAGYHMVHRRADTHGVLVLDATA